MKKKYLLYFDDVYGLWHVPFFEYICKILCENGDDVVVIIGSKYPEWFLADINIVKEFLYWSDIQHTQRDKYEVGIRLWNISSIIHSHVPDVFLLDHFPFWKFSNIDELGLIFQLFSEDTSRRIVSFVRDIYMGQKFLNQEGYDKMTQALRKSNRLFQNEAQVWDLKIINNEFSEPFYKKVYMTYFLLKNFLWSVIDGIIVFWDKKVHDLNCELDLNASQQKRLFHVWYIPETPWSINSFTTQAEKKEKKVLISTGGNLANPIMFMSLLEKLSQDQSLNIRVLLWPHINTGIKKIIIKKVLKYKNIQVTWFRSNFPELLHASDVFIWFGWYGTFMHLFQYSGLIYILLNGSDKSFKHRYYEQKTRCEKLQKYMNVHYIEQGNIETIDIHKDPLVSSQRDTVKFCSNETFLTALSSISDITWNKKT